MNILEKIVAHKKKEVDERKSLVPVKLLEQSTYFNNQVVSMKKYVTNPEKTGIIAEFKRKSPSKGMINVSSSVEQTSIGYMQAGASALSILTDKEFLRERKIIVKTDELIPVSPTRFLNMVKNQFVAVPAQFRKLTEAEFEVQKNHFMESADAKLIMYCQHLITDNQVEEIYLVTEETSATNDLKLFKKIPVICGIIRIPVITLPELLEKYPEVDLGFNQNH